MRRAHAPHTALWVAPKTIKGGPNPRDKLHGNSAINGRRRWGTKKREGVRRRGEAREAARDQ